jgi:hypothetical protein
MTQLAQPHSKRSSTAGSPTGASTFSVSTEAAPGGSSVPTPISASSPANSVSTPLPSMTGAHWRSLSPQSKAILRQVLIPMTTEGFSATEMAKRIGISALSVRLLNDYVASELRLVLRPEQPESLTDQLVQAVRRKCDTGVELIERKSYARLTLGGSTVAYVTRRAHGLRLDLPGGGLIRVHAPAEVEAVAVALVGLQAFLLDVAPA